MKRFALILVLVGLAVPFVWGADATADDLVKQAQASAAAGKFDDAVNFYEQVLTGHPEASARWYEAQLGIAQALAKKEIGMVQPRPPIFALMPLRPCRPLMPPSWSPPISSAPRTKTSIAPISFSTLNKTDRAPGLRIPWKPSATRRSRLVRAPLLPFGRKQATTAAAARLRAMTYLLTGKPKDALAQFADGLRRSSIGPESARPTVDLVLIGLRSVRGHRVGLEKDMQFVIYGSNGPDGKSGTPDDLADPFAAVLPAPPPIGQGGLAQLTPDDLATLQQGAGCRAALLGRSVFVSRYSRARARRLGKSDQCS